MLNGDTVGRSVTGTNNLGVEPILNDVGPSNNMVLLEHIGLIPNITPAAQNIFTTQRADLTSSTTHLPQQMDTKEIADWGGL